MYIFHEQSISFLGHTVSADGIETDSELVYMYNCTPHASTGYTHYFLLFGREPTLPIDQMLPIPDTTRTDIDDWVPQHRRRMGDAARRTNNQIDRKAKQRIHRHDKTVRRDDLEIGSKVLLRSRVKGRNKIQDVWDPSLHVVVGKVTDESNAIIIERVSDGKTKVVNRLDILKYACKDEETDGSQSTDEPDGADGQ